MKLCVHEEVQHKSLDPFLLYEALYSDYPRTFILETGNPDSYKNAQSILGSFRYSLIKYDSSGLQVIDNDKVKIIYKDPVSYIENLMSFYSQTNHDKGFSGGLVGYFGYGAAGLFEHIPMINKNGLEIPDIYLGITDELIVLNHKESTALIYIFYSDKSEAATASHRLKNIRDMLVQPNMKKYIDCTYTAGAITSNVDIQQFISMVSKAKRYIKEGDIFQANLSQRFHASFIGSTWGFYKRLREVNPSPFQGYINFGDMQLISRSPERLIKISNMMIEAKPIAGTRPRGTIKDEDIKLSHELIINEKERAEHIMLLDLTRNDLGRVCEYGSVKVEEFMTLESYSHVWHIVSKVIGRLKKGVTLTDILRSIFPGGTITGCPKIRCMEIIEELEPIHRGVYTGSMGYLGWSGEADLNILIRSAVVVDNNIYFHAGAGIVAESDPEAEYRETMSKAKAIFEALS